MGYYTRVGYTDMRKQGEEGKTHFIYSYMVKDHSDSEKGNPLPPHRVLFPINSKGSFICTIPQTG